MQTFTAVTEYGSVSSFFIHCIVCAVHTVYLYNIVKWFPPVYYRQHNVWMMLDKSSAAFYGEVR